MALNGIDYAILVIVAISTLIGLIRGFVREALSLFFWVFAFWVSFSFTEQMATLLVDSIPSASIRYVVAFFILFAASLIIGSLINALIAKVVEKTGLGGTDRLLGIVFGAGRGALLVALLLMLGMMLALPQSKAWQQSTLVPHFQPLVAWLYGFLPKDFKQPDEHER